MKAKQTYTIFKAPSLQTKLLCKNSSVKTSPSILAGSKHKVCILVDGDNHPFENMDGFDEAIQRINIEISIYVANDDLRQKYMERYGSAADVKLVPKGDQAVDNRIKSIAGNLAKNNDYKKVVMSVKTKDTKSGSGAGRINID